jgi:hypothetical protein
LDRYPAEEADVGQKQDRDGDDVGAHRVSMHLIDVFAQQPARVKLVHMHHADPGFALQTVEADRR